MKLTCLVFTLYAILAMSSSLASEEILCNSAAEENFKQGQVLYENGEFKAAVDKFLETISQSPSDSRYHHWLAKAYGEIAEMSGWLKAISLTKDLRKSLEHAIELDPRNIAALTDLIKYYKQAPRLLGGSEKKAKKLSKRLDKLNKEK